MGLLNLTFLGVLVVLVQFVYCGHANALNQVDQPIVILSFKASSTTEYVEIVNRSDTPVSLEGWKLEYSNVSGSNVRNLAVLTGDLDVGRYLVFASTNFVTSYLSTGQIDYTSLLYSGLADSGGFIRLYKPTSDLDNYPDGYEKIDEVGWLSSSESSQDELVVNYTGTTTSLHRCSDLEGKPIDRDDNRLDYYALTEPALNISGMLCQDITPPPDPDPVTDPPVSDPPPKQEYNSCKDMIISEVLPNPYGEDKGSEYIEIQNTGLLSMPLKGCSLSLSNGSLYKFTDEIEIGVGGFLSFNDTKTLLTLSNSKGLTVYLLDEKNNEVDFIEYPADLDDDQSWALFDDTYAATYTPTPGAINIHQPLKPCSEGYERNPSTGRCNKIVVPEIDEPVTCEAGYEINPDTGRCKKTTTALQPCPVGQERNPATNRCRTVQGTTILLAACKEGQERNPATNRCRNINVSTELLPCPVGQERNPATNRCRTIATNVSTETTQEVVEDLPRPQGSLIPVGAIGVGAISYMVFEWRNELVKFANKIKKRFKRQ